MDGADRYCERAASYRQMAARVTNADDKRPRPKRPRLKRHGLEPAEGNSKPSRI
jgi:hypothetical protein